MEHKQSKPQIETKAYIEAHNIEITMGDMLNTLVHTKDPNPLIYMIKYLISITSPQELQENSIIIIPRVQHQKTSALKASVPKTQENSEPKPHSDDKKQRPKSIPIFPHNSKSIIQKHITEPLWNKFSNIKTKLNHDLYNCLVIALQQPESVSGICVADAECYEIFHEIFDPILIDLQQWSHLDKHKTVLDLGFFKCQNHDPTGEIVKRITISIDRNLKGFSFPIGLSYNERLLVKDKIQEILEPFLDSSFKKIDCNSNGHTEPHLMDLFKDKFLHTDLIKDWPHGRELFVSDDLTIAVNLENHIQFYSKTDNGDLEKAFNKVINIAGKLNSSFENSHKYGYLTSKPEIIGTGMQVSVILKLENLLRITNSFKFKILDCNILDGKFVEISMYKTLGASEDEVFQAFANAIEFFVIEEKKLKMKMQMANGEILENGDEEYERAESLERKNDEVVVEDNEEEEKICVEQN
ncbi:hypothetical protein SteCoe_9640 [Stentor coeruleus]|uniref:Uncharacterized protein n=1 Tax=Stentor coeruleus TaxID=5963 RepID=A0A1R2CHJ2_9CILI|nr:hypothetical protein SteCoe_9640 [Stentor coeruleus]